MTAHVILSVARQVEGELMLVQSEKGYLTAAEAEKALKAKPQQTIDVIKTDAGDVRCHIVRGIFEVEVEGLESFLASKRTDLEGDDAAVL